MRRSTFVMTMDIPVGGRGDAFKMESLSRRTEQGRNIHSKHTPIYLKPHRNSILGYPTGLIPHPNSICIKQSSATVIIYPNWFEDRPSFPTRHSKVAAVLSEAGEKFSPSYRNKLFKVPRRISSTAAEMFNQFTVMHCIAQLSTASNLKTSMKSWPCRKKDLAVGLNNGKHTGFL